MTIQNDVEEILEKDYRFYVENAVETLNVSFLDACVYVIEKYNIEPKTFASRIPQYIKEKIKYECIALNKIKMEKPKCLEFE